MTTMVRNGAKFTRRSFLRTAAFTSPAVLSGLAGCGWLAGSESPGSPSPTASTETPQTEQNQQQVRTTSDGQYPGLDSVPDPLAVDSSNPIIFLDDQSTDNYMGELALAMADSGTANVEGFLLSYPQEVWRGTEEYQRYREISVTHHRKVREKASESGLDNLPPAEFGVFDHHDKPDSGVIEDTKPIGSEGTDRIVEAARAATPETPVVVAAGGDVCTVADAYLTDPSIADSLVVYWHEQVIDINEQSGYNIQNSGWSAYVVLKRLSTALDHNSGGFTITTSEVEERIPAPLSEYMLTKEHWKWGNPLRSTDWSKEGEHEAHDEKALVLASFPYTRQATKWMTVSGLQEAEWEYEVSEILPTLSDTAERSHLVSIPKIDESYRAFWSSWAQHSRTDTPKALAGE